MKRNIIQEKSFAFALQIINLYKELCFRKQEFVMSKQILRSGTSIGANVMEGEHAQSKADFIYKMNIALKEANETKYWLQLLFESSYIEDYTHKTLNDKILELIRLLASIVKTSKENNK